MVDVIRRTLLIGVGAMALTRDRFEQFIGDSVARGELSSEQGKTLVEEMTQRAEQERERVERFVRDQVSRAVDMAGLAPRSEIARLEARIDSLEGRLHTLTTAAGPAPTIEAEVRSAPSAPITLPNNGE